MRRILASSLTIAMGLFFANDVSAAGNASCSVSGGKTFVRYAAPSGPDNDIVFVLGGTHTCYTFGNGDIGVVGPVTLEGITPTHTSSCASGGQCRSGWMKNVTGLPPREGGQAFDSRDSSFDEALFGGGFPQTLTGPASAIKAVSDTVNNCPGNKATAECLQYAAVLTVLDAVPSNSSDLLRPSFYGRTASIQETPRLSELDWSGVASLDSSAVSNVPSMAAIGRRFEEVQLEAVNNYQGRKFHPEDNFQAEEYHGKIADTNAAGVLRLTLNDVDLANPVHKKAVAAVLQYGYDMAWMYARGGRWSDHSNGRQAIAAFAATLIGDPELISAVQSGHGDREGTTIQYGQNAGRGLFGQNCSEEIYWQNQRDSRSGNKFCADPYGYIDGPSVYQHCCLHGGLVAGPLAVYLTGSTVAYNRDATLDYGYRRFSFGAWSSPDPCLAASAGGGPNGRGGCITGSPSRAADELNAAHGSQADYITGNTGLFHGFVESMKDVFYQCAVEGTCTSDPREPIEEVSPILEVSSVRGYHAPARPSGIDLAR